MERITFEQEGFHGIYHPAVKAFDQRKIVIVLGGSEGNENIPRNVGKMFAEQGISALGICYWNVSGLPDNLIRVPLEPFEKAISWIKRQGYTRIAMYGISKGAELALLCASLMPDITGVIALSPMHCIWSGTTGNKSMTSKKFTMVSEFSWRGKDFPYMKAELKYGSAIWNLITQQQLNLAYMYTRPLENFDEATAIKVENIQGDILFICALEDLMWPSRQSADYMVKRLEKNNWPHRVKTIVYDKASHILVPLNPSKLNMFKVERKYPQECQNNRQEAFAKTIEWLSEW